MAQVSMPHRPAEGLYDPAFEHDACGVAFVARLGGEASHDIIAKGLIALENLDHRGRYRCRPGSRRRRRNAAPGAG